MSKTATFDTNRGTIVAELYDKDAPKTVENFEKLANAGFYDGVNFRTVSPSQSYADNTWHHFAMVVTTSTLELFVDGVSQGTSPHSNSLPVNNVVWNMGRLSNNTYYFQGSLDEIKFYNKALTPAEIIDDMNTPL